MKPISFEEQNDVYAKDQPEYLPLPVYKEHTGYRGEVISCWQLTLRERLKVLFTGKFWFCQMTFNKPLQPQLPTVNKWDVLNKEYFESLKKVKKDETTTN